MSAEEAIARAKAIAARLAGTGATAATTPEDVQQPPSIAVPNTDVNSVAEAALAAAFGTGGGGVAGDFDDGANGSSGSKRKRWGSDAGGKSDFDRMSIIGSDGILYWKSTEHLMTHRHQSYLYAYSLSDSLSSFFMM